VAKEEVRDTVSGSTNKPTRRDFLKTIGGVLGGVSLLGHGSARGQAIGSMPNGYKFYRVLTANEGGTIGILPNQLGNMTGSVMMASPLSGTGIGYVYVHATRNPQYGAASAGVFEVDINYGPTPPVVTNIVTMAIEGLTRGIGGKTVTIGHIGTGASNALGEYVTTISPADSSQSIAVANSPGVYLFRPGGIGTWSRMIGFADPVPDGSIYGADFGDVALDNDENLLISAATTHSPGASLSGYAGSQALIATSLGATASGRVVLRTGDILPFASAGIQSVGLIDLAAHHAFAAQLSAKRLDHTATRSGTALMVGNTQSGPAEHRIVAASPELISPQLASHLHMTSGQTFFGPRVDRRQDVAFVTHVSTFEPSLGSNDVEMLGYYSRGLPHQLQLTRTGTSSDDVIALGAPCIDSSGLMYGTEVMGDGTTQLFISDGVNSEIVLRSRDRIPGRAPSGELEISEILFGQHSTQVDAFGRLAFTAEFLLDPSKPGDPNNVITALVIGIPG
jgi:hypothetical protein